MPFNPRDVYDAAALYDMWLNCHACPASFDFEPNQPIGLQYYHEIGQAAKEGGWVVAEEIDTARLEDQTYLVLCPSCAGRFGIEPRPAMSDRSPVAIEEICVAMARAEGSERVA